MRFQSRHRTYTFVVRPFQRQYNAFGQATTIEGLRVKFRSPFAQDESDGPARIPGFFDSVAEQRAMHWSDEQRIEVEAALLSSPKFGHGIYLAPGETIPKVHSDIVIETEAAEAEAPEPDAPEALRCSFVRLTEDGQNAQCSRAAKVEDLCTQHARMAERAGAVA